MSRYETKFADASVSRPIVKTTIPRMADVHSGYHREWAKLQRLELELADLRDPGPPPHPEILADEFSAGDIARLKGIRESRIADLDRQARIAKGKVAELRPEASAAVVKAALADHSRIIDAMAGPVRQLLAVAREHDGFVAPAEGEGVWLSTLIGRAVPGYVIRELQSWLDLYERETK